MGTTIEVYIATLDKAEVTQIAEAIVKAIKEASPYIVEIKEEHRRIVIK